MSGNGRGLDREARDGRGGATGRGARGAGARGERWGEGRETGRGGATGRDGARWGEGRAGWLVRGFELAADFAEELGIFEEV